MTIERMVEILAAHSSIEYDFAHWEYICSECGEGVAHGHRKKGYQTLGEHQARMLEAEGFGHVPTALRCTATMIEGRSNQFFDTMQRMVGEADTDPDDILRYGSYGSEAQSVAYIIRDRADEKEGMRAYAG